VGRITAYICSHSERSPIAKLLESLSPLKEDERISLTGRPHVFTTGRYFAYLGSATSQTVTYLRYHQLIITLAVTNIVYSGPLAFVIYVVIN